MKLNAALRIMVVCALVAGMIVPASPAAATSVGGVNEATASMYHVGDPVTWELRVLNPDADGPITVDIWDVLPSGTTVVLADDVVIPAGGSWSRTLSGAYSVRAADLVLVDPGVEVIENALYVRGTGSNGDLVQGEIWDSARVLRPAVAISTTVDFDLDGTFTDAETNLTGQVATWRVLVTNTGTAELENLAVTDTGAHAYGAPFSLAPGASQTLSYTQTITAPVTLTAQVSGVDGLGAVVGPVSDDARVTPQVPGLTAVKTVDFNGDGVYSAAESAPVGTTASWKIVLTNSGTAPLTGVTASDGSGWSVGPIALAAGESATFTHSTVVTATTINTASAQGYDALQRVVGPVTSSATATPLFPNVGIVKEANVTTATAGQVITYTLTYRNDGDAPATSYVIADDFDERWASVTDAAGGTVSGGVITWASTGPLAPGASGTIVYKLTVKDVTIIPTNVTTNLDNTVTIAAPNDSDPDDNKSTDRVLLTNPTLPYTPPTPTEPYLPFTGGQLALMAAAAGIAAFAGLLLRGSRRGDER